MNCDTLFHFDCFLGRLQEEVRRDLLFDDIRLPSSLPFSAVFKLPARYWQQHKQNNKLLYMALIRHRFIYLFYFIGISRNHTVGPSDKEFLNCVARQS